MASLETIDIFFWATFHHVVQKNPFIILTSDILSINHPSTCMHVIWRNGSHDLPTHWLLRSCQAKPWFIFLHRRSMCSLMLTETTVSAVLPGTFDLTSCPTRRAADRQVITHSASRDSPRTSGSRMSQLCRIHSGLILAQPNLHISHLKNLLGLLVGQTRRHVPPSRVRPDGSTGSRI